jgi:hypothetical protein
MNRVRIIIVLALSMSVLHSNLAAQSGGPFEITESVLGAGGGTSSEGIFDVDATMGQPASGGPIGRGPFSVTSGFWNFTTLAPTAAHVSISGRVTDLSGIGVSQASLRLMTQEGEILYTRSSSFGSYRFEGVAIGQSVFIAVWHKAFVFEPRTLMVADEIAGLDFVAVR